MVVDGLLAPLRGRNPWWAVAWLSLLASAMAMAIIKTASNPVRVRSCRNRAVARLLEIWLYRAHPGLQARAIAGAAVDNLRYVLSLAWPLILSLPPMIMLLAQAHDHFNGRPLRPGDTILFEARYRDGAVVAAGDGPRLVLPPMFEADPPRVRAPGLDAVAWRLTLARDAPPGRYAVLLYPAGEVEPLTKDVVVGNGARRLSPRRVNRLGARILFPGEARLPADGAIDSLRVRYPPPNLRIGRWNVNAMAVFMTLTVLWGWALQRPLKVEI